MINFGLWVVLAKDVLIVADVTHSEMDVQCEAVRGEPGGRDADVRVLVVHHVFEVVRVVHDEFEREKSAQIIRGSDDGRIAFTS